jgi:DNA-binding transcriptional regulator PaaX
VTSPRCELLFQVEQKVAPEVPGFIIPGAMQPKTEELLHLLSWSTDLLANPTFRNLTDSFESWAYRNGLNRQLAALESQALIERQSVDPQDRLYRLSPAGRLHVLGGRDPVRCWGREWDGTWRVVFFDVPSGRDAQRALLRRYLRERGFGCLQGSVWITPDSMEAEQRELLHGTRNVNSLLLLEMHPCAGETDAEIVAGAWNFDHINRRYADYLKLLNRRPRRSLESEVSAKALLHWSAQERTAWRQALQQDPLLPAALLPAGYLGRKAWNRRIGVLREARRQLETFAAA